MDLIIQQAHHDLDLQVEKGENLTCETCKGSGKVTVSMSTFGKEGSEKKSQMHCISCSGKGIYLISSDSERKAWVLNRIQRNMWCQCEDSIGSYYRENNECKGCMSKHHYHCKKCHLITQVG